MNYERTRRAVETEGGAEVERFLSEPLPPRIIEIVREKPPIIIARSGEDG